VRPSAAFGRRLVTYKYNTVRLKRSYPPSPPTPDRERQAVGWGITCKRRCRAGVLGLEALSVLELGLTRRRGIAAPFHNVYYVALG